MQRMDCALLITQEYRFSNDASKNFKIVVHKSKVKCLTNKAVVFTKQKIQRNKALLHTVHKILALRNIILPGTYLHS